MCSKHSSSLCIGDVIVIAYRVTLDDIKSQCQISVVDKDNDDGAVLLEWLLYGVVVIHLLSFLFMHANLFDTTCPKSMTNYKRKKSGVVQGSINVLSFRHWHAVLQKYLSAQVELHFSPSFLSLAQCHYITCLSHLDAIVAVILRIVWWRLLLQWNILKPIARSQACLILGVNC